MCLASVSSQSVENKKLDELVGAFNARHGSGIGSRGKSVLVLPAAMMQGFFDPVIAKIIAHVTSLLTGKPDATKVSPPPPFRTHTHPRETTKGYNFHL